MRTFSNYTRRKIARYYRDTYDTGKTIKKFGITYKEFYKAIKHSYKIFNKTFSRGVIYKKCPTCKSFLPYNEEYFYKRQNGYFCSSCKSCMKIMSNNYHKINKDKIREKKRGYYNDYYNRQKKLIRMRQKRYYGRYRYNISMQKKMAYKRQKKMLLRRILYNL